MKAINYKKFLKNILSLFLTLLVMSNLMDFIRKPTVPEDINATALYDLQENPFFSTTTGAGQTHYCLFLGNLVWLLPLHLADN